MSGTKLLSRKAPVTKRCVRPALIIVAHGERGGTGDDRFVHGVARALECSPEFGSVHVCFISKSPDLKSVLMQVPVGPVRIYPIFMSDGYFVRKAIPRSIDHCTRQSDRTVREVSVLPPIGLSPQLPRLVAETAVNAARQVGLTPVDCRLLLVAHGSKHDQASRDATRSVAAALAVESKFACVAVSFLEEAPFVGEQLATIEGPAIVVGLFVGEGMHGAEDLPDAIEKSGRNDIVLASALAQTAGLTDLICRDLSEMTAQSNQCANSVAT